jgi:hypothetical protein
MTDQLLERPQHYTKERTEMRRSFGVEKSEYALDVFDGWWAVDGGYVAAFRDSGVGYAGRPESRPFVIFRKKEHAEKWLEVL